MLIHSMLRIVSGGLALLAAAAATHAAQTSYPARPIRFIVPFPPGGSADPLARAFGAWFSDKFGVPVVADNRPGAGTAIAHALAAKAAADGYTLVLGSSSGLSTNPAFGTKLEYDPVKDFAPVGLAAYVPQLLVVHPAVPAKSLNELSYSYTVVFNAFKRLSKGYSAAERAALFHDTAARVYRIASKMS